MRPYLLSLRLVDWLVFGASCFVFYALAAGFYQQSKQMAVLSGVFSALFWLLATVPPIYVRRPWRGDTINGLNAFAAGATGAAVLSSVDFGWKLLLTGT